MIGVAGCGRMGRPMLEALCDMGVAAAGYDPQPCSDARVSSDAAGFAARLETLFVVVRDAEQVCDVLFGAQDFVHRAPGLARIVLCATVSPNEVHRLRSAIPERIAFVDAPMSGAVQAAEARRLTFMLGGSEDDVDALVPLLSAMGETFYHMGPLGAGMQAKVLNNLLLASHIATTRLVMNWAMATGLDEEVLMDLISVSSGQNWFASHLSDLSFAHAGFDAENEIGLLVKDVAAAVHAAPSGLDMVLPQTVMTALRQLEPR